MSWSGLASNQMVSYTDAQGGGFSLQPGQSSVTSDQCMTKNDATTKYVLDTSYLTSYASNQLIPKSVWVAGISSYSWSFSSTSSSNTTTACGFSFGLSLYSSTSTITAGSVLYTTAALTTVFNGGNLYRKGPSNSAWRINTTGTVTAVIPC
jgi:hypothetical protein